MIRDATEQDRAEFLRLCRLLHAETAMSFVPLKIEKMDEMFTWVLKQDPEYPSLLRVSEEDGKLVAMLLGFITNYYFSDAKYAGETFLYVTPERRGSSIAFRLWRQFRDWAKENGALELSHGVSTGINVENAHRFFTGVGMTHMGGIYKLRL
jgi:GNAT superfamily N-acetyltransferase